MASASGNSSGSTKVQNSRSEDQRKRKRMESNRESARRSRMRKQKHVDDLVGQVNELKKENSKILRAMKVTREEFVKVEAKNCVLRAQMSELGQRLESLNEIMSYMNNGPSEFDFDFELKQNEVMNNPWEMVYVNQQAIMASAAADDMLKY